MKKRKYLIFLLMGCLFPCVLWAQNAKTQKVTLQLKEASVKEFFDALHHQTKLNFVYNNEQIKSIPSINVTAKNESLTNVLDRIFKSVGFGYNIDDNTITLYRIRHKDGDKKQVNGKVVDGLGDPLPGVNVAVKEEKNVGATTDMNGKFTLKAKPGQHLVVSFIGMKTQVVLFKGQDNLNITLVEDAEAMDEVVVNGYYTKNKQSFTGNAISVAKADLEKVSNTNLMSALQVFDPSFKLQEDISAGSNPNSVPKMRIRGDSGFGSISETNLKNDPNQPTFILDGYEVTAEKVYDLNMDRVASVTILKDASATAIYGSRAANGVVVITTKAPEQGRLRISYKFDGLVQTPDLRDYNLMNAAEKLEAERLAGEYESTDPFTQQKLDMDYSLRLRNVKRGVDTYWLSQPIQTVMGQKHSLYLEGGDRNIRYGISANYQNNPGVMKDSFRDRLGIDVNLQYNWKDKVLFRNNLSVSKVKSQESPYGSFSEYVKTNPY